MKLQKSNEEDDRLRIRLSHLLNGFSELATRGSKFVLPLTVRIRNLLKQFGELRTQTDVVVKEKTEEVNENFREPGHMRDRFAMLLNAYSEVVTQDRVCLAELTVRLRNLLERYAECHKRADTSERTHAFGDYKSIRELLVDFKETIDRYHQQQEEVADDFNLLEVMRLTGKEIRHSMVLAWLLDHDMNRLGTHAQGNLGFRLFLKEFSELHFPIGYADSQYWVRREVSGDESVVDIEVACRGRFLIHIENKIWSSEGTDQTDREWSDLQRRAKGLNVMAPDIYALFLTPDGAKPVNPNFRAIRWRRIVSVLEAFADLAKPVDVKLFTRHYARALRRFIVIQDKEGNDHAERTVE